MGQEENAGYQHFFSHIVSNFFFSWGTLNKTLDGVGKGENGGWLVPLSSLHAVFQKPAS